jgi:hypothetical protein
MSHTGFRRHLLGAAILAAITHPAAAQKSDSTLLRPTQVTVRITNDVTTLYNRSYSAGNISTKCGLADYGYPHRKHSFAVMFPDTTAIMEVTSVNFDSDSLMSRDSTASYYLAVGIRVGQTGTPPLYVVRANEPQRGEPGIARLTRLPGGRDSLHVTGVATTGVKVNVEMWLVCQP